MVGGARNLVLFCFYFSNTAIAEYFCYSQCKIQVTIGLILTKEIWSCFGKKLIKLINWVTFDTWSDNYVKRCREKLIHQNCTRFLLICLQWTWEAFMFDTLMMSSKAREDFKRESSVYKKFQKRRYLFNSKSRDHIISKTKPSMSLVNSFASSH